MTHNSGTGPGVLSTPLAAQNVWCGAGKFSDSVLGGCLWGHPSVNNNRLGKHKSLQSSRFCLTNNLIHGRTITRQSLILPQHGSVHL